MSFLEHLVAKVKPLAEKEYQILVDLKKNDVKDDPVVIQEWDKSYYYKKFQNQVSPEMDGPQFAKFFSIGNVFSGLSELFKGIFGVTLYPAKVMPGEVWANEGTIQKLYVVHEEEGLLGIVYCDLFKRDGKGSTAAHYTIRCGCSSSLPKEESIPNVVWGPRDPLLYHSSSSSVKGEEETEYQDYVEMAQSLDLPISPKDQIPIVVLSASLAEKNCSMYEIETLLHEMGHVMHSKQSVI